MIWERICQLGKRFACGAHLLGQLIKDRGEATLTPDFQTEVVPGGCLLFETGNKFLERHCDDLLRNLPSIDPLITEYSCRRIKPLVGSQRQQKDASALTWILPRRLSLICSRTMLKLMS